MHLNSLRLRNFKKYRRAEISFQDGLTGIVGSNGSGKSTLVEAIAWALYGNRAASIKKDYIRNALAGESDNVEVTLSLSLGRQEMVINRSMKGKGLMPDALLKLDGQPIAAGSREVDQRLEEILKIGYQDFMKTFYARQKDLDNLLKEGGAGKREYLLKLLGLDDIRERAMEQIKSDRGSLEDQKNRLAGALAEIGDVEARLEEAAVGIQQAEGGLAAAEQARATLSQQKEMRNRELEAQAERGRSHDLLAEKRSRLVARDREKREALKAEEMRLKEIEASKKLLADLQPRLERLAAVAAGMEALEPKRKSHEEVARMAAVASAGLERERKALSENEERLVKLLKDEASLQELEGNEKEHEALRVQMQSLEEKRDSHARLQSGLKEERIRQSAASANLVRTEAAIRELIRARARYDEVFPRKDEVKRLEGELANLSAKKQRQKEKEALLAQRDCLQARAARLEGEEALARRELEALGDLDGREAQLRHQDAELDRLGTEQNVVLADLKGGLKVAQSSRSEAERNLRKVRTLGEEGLCPTCERPLEGQLDLLIGKYQQAQEAAEKETARLQAMIRTQTDKIDGITRSRSSLKRAFDDLNSKKARRSALQADLRSLGVQLAEVKSEMSEAESRIEAIGEIGFDLQRMEQAEAALKALAPLIQECGILAARLDELPRREKERYTLAGELKAHEERCRSLEEQIQALGYAEADYTAARKRQAELKLLHDRFLALTERVRAIPALEERMAGQRKEQERLARALQKHRESLQALGFDPSEYEALQKERKALVPSEAEAQRIRIRLALEPEVRRRLEETASVLASLEKDLAEAAAQLQALCFSREEHEAARLALGEAEKELERARKEVSERRVQMGVLRAGLEQLLADAQRKKKHERTLRDLARRLEVVDTTRVLVNGFMDQVLKRVKSDIARTAGEILDEISGKYSLLKIDEDFNILVEDGGEYYPISRYSGGEIDMIAVSVRVAISEYLMRFGPDGESYSFLIMDEVFGSQDQEHREKMIQMLRGLEQRFPQVIAISHISDVQGQFDSTLQVVEDEIGGARVEAV